MKKKRIQSKKSEAKKSRTFNINLQALEVFCEVIRLQSFSRGGAAFGISQSAASQLVAHLEGELGVQLIDRGQRPLMPTAAGRSYYVGSQELLHRHRTILDEVSRGQEMLSGSVRVASIYSVGLHTLNHYLQIFMTRYPGTQVHLEYFHPTKVYSAVLEDEADIGIVSYPKSHRNLEMTNWLEEEMVVACPSNHHLSRQRSMRLEDLDGESFVAFDVDLIIRREIDRALRGVHVGVNIVSAFDNIETIKNALEVTGSISVLPRPSIQREVERGTLKEISLEGIDLIRPVGIIYKKKKKCTRTTEIFLKTLLEPREDSVEGL